MTLRGAPSARRLLPVAAAVLVVHILLLRVQPDQVTQPPRAAAGTFSTRQVQVPPAPQPAATRPVVTAAPAREAPAPRAPARVREEQTEPPEQVAVSGVETQIGPVPVAPAPAPAALSGVPSHTTAIPEPARIRYDVEVHARGLTVNGQAELRWRHDGNQYDARLEIGAPLLPTRVQTSSGRITPQGLEPTRFSDKTRTEEATHFERDKGKLVFSNNRPEAALQAGMQDRLSVVVQLAAMVGGDPARYPPGSTIAMPTASTREADTWLFAVEALEDLDLPGGRMQALKLQRMPRKEFDYKLELWLAPRMDYAPVRLRLTYPNGDSLDQRWAATDKG
jgi:hypothetical protein